MAFDLETLLKAAAPTGAPRGGKYIKREWTGERWKYTYAEEKAPAHGPLEPAKLDGETFEHTLESVVDDLSGNPELDYKNALDKVLSTKGDHQVANPSGGAPLTLSVTGQQKVKLRLTDASGEKIKDFASRGAYEAWYIGTANTTQMLDHEGTPIFDIRPIVGSVQDGEFVPSHTTVTKVVGGVEKTYEANRWAVSYAKNYPPEKRVGKASKWLKTSRENAEKHARKMLRDQEIALGIDRDMPELTGDDKKAVTSAEKESSFAAAGTVADRIQSGQVKWKIDKETGKRVLDASERDKNMLIAEAAKEYYPVMLSLASSMANNAFFTKDQDTNQYGNSGKRGWMERFLGFDLPSGKDPEFVFPDPGSPAYAAIEHALNTFDPAMGVGFTGYLAGAKGQLYWKMLYAKHGFIEELKRKSSSHTADGTDRADITSASDEARGGSAHLQSFDDMLEDGDVDEWHDTVVSLLDTWEDKAPNHEPEKLAMARDVMDKFNAMHPVDQVKMAPRISEALMDLIDWRDVIGKALVSDAILCVQQEELIKKAMEILTKDKNVALEHTYSHKEGDEDTPVFYYVDPLGNYVRYTNAPTDHEDNSRHFGEATLHPSEPLMASNPEYFSPDGRKLTRAPGSDTVEWNPAYNRYDPANLWIGRWVDQTTGEYCYTYADSDIRSFPQLSIHQQNALVDVQLPYLRQQILQLYTSPKIKDQITALALALMDQGRMRATEIACLTPADVQLEGNLARLGTRQLYVGPRVRTALEALLNRKAADEPLFSVPMQDQEGQVDNEMSRRLGPRYLAAVLDQMGVSLYGLQTYHATTAFVNELQRLIAEYGTSWEQAVQQATLAAALEWGHDFSGEANVLGVLQLTQAVLVDPVVVNTVYQNAVAQGLLGSVMQRPLPPTTIPIPQVSLELQGRTADELEFSAWLHSTPLHEHIAPETMVMKSREGLVPVERQITSKTGKTFTRTYWAKPGEAGTTSENPASPAAMKALQAMADMNLNAVRAALDDVVYDSIHPYRKSLSSDVMEVEEQPHNVLGMHHWDGRIGLDPGTAEKARRFAQAYASDPEGMRAKIAAYKKANAEFLKASNKEEALKSKLRRKKIEFAEFAKQRKELALGAKIEAMMQAATDAQLQGADAFKIVIHEVLHSTGPMEKKAYVRQGAVIEEVTTEVLARREMVRQFGLPADWMRRSDTYEPWVNTFVNGIKDIYEVDDDKAWSILEDASEKLKQRSDGGEDPDQLQRMFAALFPPTGHEEKDKPQWSLVDRDWQTGEFRELSSREYNLAGLAFKALEGWDKERS